MSYEENRMSPEETKAFGRRLVEALNTGNLPAIDEVFAAGYVDRNPFPGTTPDREGLKQGLAKFRTAFPDYRYTIEDEITAGDKLAHRLSARGTPKGELQGVTRTGKQVNGTESHIARLGNCKGRAHRQ